MKINSWKLNRWTVCVIALISFAAGSLVTARLTHINQVRADSNRVFEMHVYHTLPGKVPVLESQFRDTTSKLLAKHDLKIVGNPTQCTTRSAYSECVVMYPWTIGQIMSTLRLFFRAH